MSYQVLARKYRPRSFGEMAGQEHVLRALINGLEHDRLHHAYLFTGTRGVGKTTVARILAKCLNCEPGVTAEPCGECAACLEIDQGRFVDLIEVDAASRTRVEDTRELLDNVQYAPTRGRYKVYLIDEVHMLSTHSFNALLKTLEEPPPHVKFLLATTDPQKVPVTILSRCLQFNLKRLPAELIVGHLEQIAGREGIATEANALRRLARAADGSMRDALSLTDQAIAFGGGAVNDEDVKAMLGSIEDDSVLEILEALAEGDGAGLLEAVDRLSERAPDFQEVLAALLGMLHTLSLMQTIPGVVGDEMPDRDRIEALASRLGPEDVQLFYQIALIGRRDLPLAPEPRIGLEMVLLRMLAFQPAGPGDPAPRSRPRTPVKAPGVESGMPTPAPKPVASPAPRAEQPTPAVADAPSAEEATPAPETTPAPEAAPALEAAEAPASALPEGAADEWHALLDQLGLGGMAYALATQCVWGGREGEVVTLRLDSAHEHLRNALFEARIEKALGDHYGAAVRLRIQVGETGGVDTPAERSVKAEQERMEAARRAIAEDPHVAAMKEAFDAQVMDDSIQPVRSQSGDS